MAYVPSPSSTRQATLVLPQVKYCSRGIDINHFPNPNAVDISRGASPIPLIQSLLPIFTEKGVPRSYGLSLRQTIFPVNWVSEVGGPDRRVPSLYMSISSQDCILRQFPEES